MNETFVYEHNNSLYINLTNKCTNKCEFCVRNQMDGIDGYDLWLKREPEATDVIAKLEEYNIDSYKEIVFCGYGEPTIKLDVLLNVAKYIKENFPQLETRINTNGQANLYFKEDITPRLKGLIDKLSISLNAPTAKEYQEICHSDFGEDAFDGLLEFAWLAKRYIKSVRLTVVDLIGVDKIKKCKEVADNYGIDLYVRNEI